MERLTVKITLEVANAEGKVTAKNELTLGEMQLVDVVNVEKALSGTVIQLLESQAVDA